MTDNCVMNLSTLPELYDIYNNKVKKVQEVAQSTGKLLSWSATSTFNTHDKCKLWSLSEQILSAIDPLFVIKSSNSSQCTQNFIDYFRKWCYFNKYHNIDENKLSQVLPALSNCFNLNIIISHDNKLVAMNTINRKHPQFWPYIIINNNIPVIKPAQIMSSYGHGMFNYYDTKDQTYLKVYGYSNIPTLTLI